MFCPACNGIENDEHCCLSCGGAAADYGRLSDWMGPYAPYEPIGDQLVYLDSHMTSESACCHILYCSSCRQMQTAWIAAND